MVNFFKKFIVFRVLENALVNQKIITRHFYSYRRKQSAAQGFFHNSPGKGKLFLFPDSSFLKIF